MYGLDYDYTDTPRFEAEQELEKKFIRGEIERRSEKNE